jgi:hypothetical protein
MQVSITGKARSPYVQLVAFFFKDFALSTSFAICTIDCRSRIGIKNNIMQLYGALWSTRPPLFHDLPWILCLSLTSQQVGGTD